MNSADGPVEVLTVMQRYASMLADLSPKFELHEERRYSFNIRLYEKLLCGIFDVLEEGQIVEVTKISFLKHIHLAKLLSLVSLLKTSKIFWSI